jgi:hypothetical protein
VFGALDTIAWSPADSEIEAATEIYVYFLAGIDAPSNLGAGGPSDVVSWERRPTSQPYALHLQIRERLLYELDLEATSAEPGIALLCVLALWRDCFAQRDQSALETFRVALTEHVLIRGRREFELPRLWSPNDGVVEVAPNFGGRQTHWRLFDVAQEAHRWTCATLEKGESALAVLPPVATPDGDLRTLISEFGAEKLVNERQYWGVGAGEECLVVVEEADQSRRLLRDCEERARGQFTWGYGGAGPRDLGDALVADILGNLAYCPSCFGAIPVVGGLVSCPLCNGDGLRRDDIWTLNRACNHMTTSFPMKPDASLQDIEDAPPGAQWHMSRTDFLRRAFPLTDELNMEDEYGEES